MSDVSRASFLWKAPKVFYRLHRKGSSQQWNAVILAGLQQVFERTWKFSCLGEGRQEAVIPPKGNHETWNCVMVWNLSKTHLWLKGLTPAMKNELVFILQSYGAPRAPFLGSGLVPPAQPLTVLCMVLTHLPGHYCCHPTCLMSTCGTSPGMMSLSSGITASWECVPVITWRP